MRKIILVVFCIAFFTMSCKKKKDDMTMTMTMTSSIPTLNINYSAACV